MEQRATLKRNKMTGAKAWESAEIDETEAKIIDNALVQTRKRMGEFYHPNQVLGRRETIGCVALEITQRCNLDCTLCYLSENSENTKDIPLSKLFERLEQIRDAYGPGTSVQITGGDPTMRHPLQLRQIVKRTRDLGLHPALFTNGIKASREMLQDLAEVGLNDVAFHVDLTQERKGFKTEKDLNVVRKEYIDRARGLPITTIFNTTVFHGNFHELPDIVKFFVDNSDQVRFASFQMQADTGRGELRAREDMITVENVRNKINQGCNHDLAWDNILFGHHECNRYAPTYVVDGKVYNVIDDQKLFEDFLEDFKDIVIDRRDNLWKIAWPHIAAASKKPSWYLRAAKYGLSKLWEAKWGLAKTRKLDKVSFFIHNFMDAENLVCERIDTCSFMVMTEDGPISMCAHNAKRDEYITQPIKVKNEKGEEEMWDPLVDKRRAPSRQVDENYIGKVPTVSESNLNRPT